MRIIARCEDPKEIVFTLTVSATLTEWEEIRDCLGKGEYWDASEMLVRGIRDLTTQAEQTFFVKDE